MWTYYKQVYANGVWLLFREDAARHQEIFHRQKGWRPDNELSRRRQQGDVDEGDIISETEAQALIASLPASP
jgi:hypothetical protein